MDQQTFNQSTFLSGLTYIRCFVIGEYILDFYIPNNNISLEYNIYCNAKTIVYNIFKEGKGSYTGFYPICSNDCQKLGIKSYCEEIDKVEFERVFLALKEVVLASDAPITDRSPVAIDSTKLFVEKPCWRCGRMNDEGSPVCWGFTCGVELRRT